MQGSEARGVSEVIFFSHVFSFRQREIHNYEYARLD